MPSPIVYNRYKYGVQQGDYNVASGGNTLYVMLVNGYTPSASHATRSDITNESSGTGYTSGGQALTGQTLTQDNTNNRGVFAANNVSWSSSTVSATGAVVYKSTGSASTDLLICYVDFGGTYSTSAGTFLITWPATGICYIG